MVTNWVVYIYNKTHNDSTYVHVNFCKRLAPHFIMYKSNARAILEIGRMWHRMHLISEKQFQYGSNRARWH